LTTFRPVVVPPSRVEFLRGCSPGCKVAG